MDDLSRPYPIAAKGLLRFRHVFPGQPGEGRGIPGPRLSVYRSSRRASANLADPRQRQEPPAGPPFSRRSLPPAAHQRLK